MQTACIPAYAHARAHTLEKICSCATSCLYKSDIAIHANLMYMLEPHEGGCGFGFYEKTSYIW